MAFERSVPRKNYHLNDHCASEKAFDDNMMACFKEKIKNT